MCVYTGRKKTCLVISAVNLYLIDNRLHFRLVLMVAIEQRRPLLWTDAKTCVHGHLYDLTVMLATKGLVCTELKQDERE